MTAKRSSRLVASLVAVGLVAAACGGDDDDDAADDEPAEATADEPADEPADATADEPADEPAGEELDVDLASVCPSPLVIQTDWFPESEHGALYQMVGDGYSIDADNLTVTGPLWAPGPTPAGIDIEVRTGGPAIGFAAPRVQMYTDDAIHIGYTSLDSQATAWDTAPLVSVMAPLEKNPQIIMWDPETYPDIETIADVGEAGITVNIFGGGGFSDYFVAAGIWSADQVDPSYDGQPGRFIAAGDIAQQGFASAEPYNYEFVFEEWGKPVAFELLHDAGYQTYSQTLGVKPTDLEELRPCLEKFIPIVQQSVVDFSADPARANAVIIDAVETFDAGWVYNEGVAEYAVATMTELGLHGNGPDDTIGNLDEARIQKVIDDARLAGLDVPDDLVATDMFTNEFIDTTIGFPSSGGDDGEDAAGADVDLASVCPSPLVIQTDWFPESEHGALYQMVGDGYSIDADNLTVTGPLWAPGPTPAGIDIEVRTGGPAIGFAAPRVQMYTDDAIHIGYTSLDSQATAWDTAPLVSVMAPLEKNPQIIMWDPETYPDIETIADVGEAGITVNIFGGGGFSDYFVAAGIWSADQVDPSYDGQPGRFIAAGDIAQQGFASAEPYNYEFVFEEWGKPVAFELLHDAGYQTYSQTLGVKPTDLEELRPCLEKFIPIVQQSVVDFSADPARANAVIIDAVETFDAGWVYNEGVAEYAVATMTELGLHGNGPDDTIGNLDEARIQKVIDDARLAGLDVPDDLVAADMFTNEFIDTTIGF